MDRPSNKKLYIFLLLSFLFILQTFLYENDTCSPCNTACFQDTSYIELVYRPETPDISQFNNDSFLNDLDNDLSSYALQHVLNEELKLSRLRGNWVGNVIIERHQELPFSHIISFLQKKNHWHQSSDDEPLPHIYS